MNAATMELLIARGLTGEQMLEVARAMETDKPQSSAAKRQARYRQRKQESVTSDVTGDVTPPLKDNSKPLSASDEADGEPSDPIKELFDLGVSMLKSQGQTEAKARSIIGNWRKGRSPGEVVAALIDAKTRSISNLVEWMPKRLTVRSTGPPSYLDYLIENQAESRA